MYCGRSSSTILSANLTVNIQVCVIEEHNCEQYYDLSQTPIAHFKTTVWIIFCHMVKHTGELMGFLQDSLNTCPRNTQFQACSASRFLWICLDHFLHICRCAWESTLSVALNLLRRRLTVLYSIINKLLLLLWGHPILLVKSCTMLPHCHRWCHVLYFL